MWCVGERDQQQARATDGTYPENDVEAEDEVLDAAAHFMSLEMLPGNHRDGLVWLLFVSMVATSRSEELSGDKDSHPRGCPVLDSAAYLLFFAPRLDETPSVVSAADPQHDAVRGSTKGGGGAAEESLGASAAPDGWERFDPRLRREGRRK